MCPCFCEKREQISNLCLKTPTMPSWREKYGWHRGSGGEQIFQNMRKTPTGSYRCVRRAGPRRADSETSLRSVSSCHGSRRVRRAGLRPLTRAQTIAAFAAYKNKKNRALASKLAGHGSFSAPTRKTSLRSVSSCHGSRRDTYNKKKGMALSKLSHAFLFVVVVAARC